MSLRDARIMTAEELNIAIATKVMGYRESQVSCWGRRPYWEQDGKIVGTKGWWKPVEELNQVALAERALNRRGLYRAYVCELFGLLRPGEPFLPSYPVIDLLMQATAAQRCRAMVLTMEK